MRNILILFIFLFSGGTATFAQQGHPHLSAYADQEKREIKTLSAEDIAELSSGRGWGFAKAAELNGVPGPVHLLEMKTEIGLTPDQITKIEQLHEEMKKDAIPLGLALIELERELNLRFADRSMTQELLSALLDQIATVRKQLSYVHLASHLRAAELVTPEQVAVYNRLRGYGTDDPCTNIPQGHDAEMWKEHHGCRH